MSEILFIGGMAISTILMIYGIVGIIWALPDEVFKI